jgi:hypothetical protein
MASPLPQPVPSKSRRVALRATGPTIDPPTDGQGYVVPPREAQPSPECARIDSASTPARPTKIAEVRQFTLGQLLALVTLAGLLVAPVGLLPRSGYAMLVGACALMALAYVTLGKPAGAIARLAWWMIFVLYVAASLAACLPD